MSRHGEAFMRNYTVNGLMNRLIGSAYVLEFDPHAYAPFNPFVYAATLVSSAGFIGFCLFYKRHEKASVAGFLAVGLSLTIASPIAWEHH
jgi:hypothetical protein